MNQSEQTYLEKPAQHTPGPWTVDDADPDQVWGTGKNAVRLAQAIHWPKHDAAANAHLIAAAPCLLAACERLLNTVAMNEDDMHEEDCEAIDAARAAIAKARGSR